MYLKHTSFRQVKYLGFTQQCGLMFLKRKEENNDLIYMFCYHINSIKKTLDVIDTNSNVIYIIQV